MIRPLILALLAIAPPALAEDVALVVGNGSYDHARGLWGADDVADTAAGFEAAGFRVFAGEDLAAGELRALAADFAAAADGSGRIAVALAGHFVRSGRDAWFLGTDADRPDLIGVGAEGLLVSTVLEIAGRAPGRAVVLLGTEDRSIRLGGGLAPGLGGAAGTERAVPQGVAVIRGDAGDLADFIDDALLVPGQAWGEAVAEDPGLVAEGFVPRDLAFIAAAAAPAPQAQPAAPPAPAQGERAAWAAALAEDTVEGYRAFLRAYPAGANATLARQAIARLGEPAAGAADAAPADEALTREERRAVQRNLSLLGYETGGIDGIFGPATRRAVAGWQRTNGEEPSGVLTSAQIERIGAQATRRAAELEAEAEARRAAIEAEDRTYWQRTGALGGEENLRAYLRRYPEGLYAELATERLAPFEAERRAEAEAADRLAWEIATEQDSVAAYRDYLQDQPQGAFRERAEERIATLSLNENDAAERTEAALGLNPITRNLIEGRLDAVGLDPGRIDGTFDSRTRRAIRRYQAARDLPATGFLSQDTVVRLLADSILR